MSEQNERQRGREYVNRAEASLHTGDKVLMRRELDHLLRWHELYHSPNRPPYLNCTGCAVWPVILQLRASLAARQMEWLEPRRVDVWWWMDIQIIRPDTSIPDGYALIRGGRVSWNQDGTEHYRISMDYAEEGIGLHCWPEFRALSDAQEFVERLMMMPLAEAERLHGQEWPGVVR